MSTILISGGTGMIGKKLGSMLADKGHQIRILSRTPRPNQIPPQFEWNPGTGYVNPEAIKNCDCVLHLAGINIAGSRWTPKRKKQIIQSRIKTAEILFNSIKSKGIALDSFISASAIGYYGALSSEHIYMENDPPANDFLGETCLLWEQSADHFGVIAKRVVKLRIGVVLDRFQGAFPKFDLQTKLFLGTALGTGKQYIPWIHIEDLCRIFIAAVENRDLSGPFNAVASEHVSNERFIKTLSEVNHRPFWRLNVPSFFLKLIFGEMSVMFLKGSRVSNEKILKTGFKFKFTKLKDALLNLTE
ncbi:MAG: TIGR01777 family protein [Flavobacteriales bacterium]|nr:TIGR01777 family protein [Flavobacteriales bacterium]